MRLKADRPSARRRGLARLGSGRRPPKKIYAPPARPGPAEYAETLPAAGGNVATPAMGGGKPHGSRAVQTGLRQGRKPRSSRSWQGRAVRGRIARATHQWATAGGAFPSSSITAADQNSGLGLSGLLDLIGGSDSGGSACSCRCCSRSARRGGSRRRVAPAPARRSSARASVQKLQTRLFWPSTVARYWPFGRFRGVLGEDPASAAAEPGDGSPRATDPVLHLHGAIHRRDSPDLRTLTVGHHHERNL